MAAERVGLEQGNVPRESCVWVVRGEPGGGESVGGSSFVEYNLAKDVVTLGWGDRAIDAPRTVFEDREMLNRYIEQWHEDNKDPERKESEEETTVSNVWLFCNEIEVGDLVVLPPIGEKWIAIGEVTGPAERDADRPDGAQLYRQVEWLPERDLAKVLMSEVPGDLQNSIWSSGTVFSIKKPGAYRRLMRLVDPHPGGRSGDEAGVRPTIGFEVPEGAKKREEVNRYERDPGARRWRLEHDDYTCQVCGLRFEDRYGEFALGYMQVHHKVPLSQITDHDNYKVNPATDLVAVCPNCHAMLHHHPDRPCTVEKLKQEMKKAQE